MHNRLFKSMTFVPLALLLLALSPVTARAAAPTLAVDRQCYNPGETINYTGSGYSPNGQITPIFVRGSVTSPSMLVQSPFRASPWGTIAGSLKAPELSSRDLSLEGTVFSTVDLLRGLNPMVPVEEEDGSTAFIVRDTFVYVPRWVDGNVSPRRFTTVKASGFTQSVGRTLYVHYVRLGKVKTIALGRLRAPCGDLTRRMREFPFRPVPAGTYRVQFDTRRTYSPGGQRDVWSGVRVKQAVR